MVFLVLFICLAIEYLCDMILYLANLVVFWVFSKGSVTDELSFASVSNGIAPWVHAIIMVEGRAKRYTVDS